ncbi:MAG: hypothetical protein QM323_03075 [Acidobacteriota bacterium]|nr:hypothetical protein [Acidobacteriota bacterium]
MGGYLYYVPGAGHDVDYHAAGLDYAFDDRSPTRCPVLRGPDGAAGVVLSCDEPMRARYVPAEQEWGPMPGTGLQVGYWRDRLPGPQDLARTDLLDGHPLTLLDGREWIVPIARKVLVEGGEVVAWPTALPCTVRLDDAGKWTIGDVVPRYRWLWEIAGRWLDARFGATETDDGISYDFDTLFDDAAAVLGANYRIGRAEASLAGLFETASAKRVLDLLIDVPTFEAVLKKKRAGAASSG